MIQLFIQGQSYLINGKFPGVKMMYIYI